MDSEDSEDEKPQKRKYKGGGDDAEFIKNLAKIARAKRDPDEELDITPTVAFNKKMTAKIAKEKLNKASSRTEERMTK